MKKLTALLMAALLFTACGADTAQIKQHTDVITEGTAHAAEMETIAVTEPASEAVEAVSAEKILAEMTTEQKIAQLLLSRCPNGTGEELMAKHSFGGYTLYGRDFENQTADSISATISAYTTAASIPPFIAVDEEGGSVCRISGNAAFRAERFHSNQEMAAAGIVESETAEKAQLLKSLGINLNLAPVADLTTNPDDYIYPRSFATDADTAGRCIAQIVELMNENSVGCCLKHFPGYGPNVNTHTGIAVDDRSADSFETNDFLPFEYGIEAGAPAIMVNHNIINAFDSQRPASLSPEIHRILRQELGFDGVIISDDLNMDAILDYCGDENRFALAVIAGNDLLCTSDWEGSISEITAAVNDGTITEERLDESVLRILNMKIRLGIIS